MRVTTPPLILHGFEYVKLVKCLNQAVDANGVKFKSRRRQRDRGIFCGDEIEKYLVFEDLSAALAESTGIDISENSGNLSLDSLK